MTRQIIYLPGWDWIVIVYYLASIEDSKEILHMLRLCGSTSDTLMKAKDNLEGVMIDTGLTYSNDDKKCSIVVISEVSRQEEFWNTFDHEKGHLVRHIGAAYDIDCSGEEQQYLAGDVAEAMYPIARAFI